MDLLLAAQVRPYLEVARSAEWGPNGVVSDVIAAEVQGELSVGGLSEPVRWRADRLDRRGGDLALVDYKISRPPSSAKGEETRRRHLLRSIALGNTLQGVAYALAAPDGRGEGRYLYLRPEIGAAPEAARHVRIAAADVEMADAFTAAVAAVAAAWDAGAMFPRMEEPDGSAGRACAFCAVREACLVDDSGVRRRLVDWLGAAGEDGEPVERAARGLWQLGFAGAEQEEAGTSEEGP
jgi:hypothetical protein